MVARGAASAEPVIVEYVEEVTREGLFAPVTSSGIVIVDGVVASSYSDWILDPLFDALSLTHKLHDAMHVVHAPLRALYILFGPNVLAVLSPIVAGMAQLAQLDMRQVAASTGMAST